MVTETPRAGFYVCSSDIFWSVDRQGTTWKLHIVPQGKKSWTDVQIGATNAKFLNMSQFLMDKPDMYLFLDLEKQTLLCLPPPFRQASKQIRFLVLMVTTTILIFMVSDPAFHFCSYSSIIWGITSLMHGRMKGAVERVMKTSWISQICR